MRKRHAGTSTSRSAGFHRAAPTARAVVEAAPGSLAWSRRPLLVLSGCFWQAEGGAQRPVALARALSGQGWPVVLYNSHRLQPTGYVDGVYCVGPNDWSGVWSQIHSTKGVVLFTLPGYYESVYRLSRAGWTVVYDMLDDWEAFVEDGHEITYLDKEPELVRMASVVTCSATALAERAAEMGASRVVLVPNGGPGTCIAPEHAAASEPRDAPIRAVYAGFLKGNWLDWDVIKRFCHKGKRKPSVTLDLIGQPPEEVPDLPGVRFLGQKPHPETLRLLTEYDVGIIPFKGEALCRSVDPIKWYDYRAAGLWVVASPVMTEIAGREATILTKDLRRGVREAAKRSQKQKVPHDAKADSWDQRAGLILNSVADAEQAEVTRAEYAFRAGTATRVEGRAHDLSGLGLRVTWAGSSRCNAPVTCPYCCNSHERAKCPTDLPFSTNKILAGLLALNADHGPLLLSICYGDALASEEMAVIAGRLAPYVKLDLVTNMTFPIEWLDHIEPHGNVAMCCSFHPHLWGGEIEPFLAKRRQVRERGIYPGMTQIVGYPPLLARARKWIEQLREADASPTMLVFNGGWQGRQYPEAYSEEEWEAVLGGMATFEGGVWREDLARHQPPEGLLCRCGKDYIYVKWDGTILRCVMPMPGGVLGNLFSGGVRLLPEAAPCGAKACPCTDLWKFIVPPGGKK